MFLSTTNGQDNTKNTPARLPTLSGAASTRARDHDLYLFALLGQLQVADEDEALVADAGAFFGRWVRGCARLFVDHGALTSVVKALGKRARLPGGRFYV